MNNLNYFYRAYKTYREELKENRDSNRFKKSITSQKNKTDFLTMKRYECKIEEDWVLEIEKGLVYIGKAIREDRQFIRNEGDILPIEKIRSVSQDSITDLAKHSNYITRLPEEEDDLLVPDKLLMIQRENDYQIYENRVLFTTLTYLKDFVSLRLDKINETVSKYEGKAHVKKEVNVGYRSIDFTMELHETQNDDPIAMQNKEAQQLVHRLTLILNDILLLLRTELMVEVSKAPPVKRPIVKTNVLKINPNFKESLALFEYISAYNKPGYEIILKEYTIKPLDDKQTEAFSEIILLASFLTYQYNNALEPALHEQFLAEEKKREQIRDQELLDRLAALMDKARKSGKEINEYLLLLEDGYKILEKQIGEAKEELIATINKYEEHIVELKEEHERYIIELNEKHERIVNKILEDHALEIQTLNSVHAEELATLEAQKDAEFAQMQAHYVEEIAQMQERHSEQLGQMEHRYEEQITQMQTTISAQDAANKVLTNEVAETKKNYANLQKETEKTLAIAAKETAAKIAKAEKEAADTVAKAKQEAIEKVTAATDQLTLTEAELFNVKLMKGEGPKPSEMTSRDRFLELQEQKRVLDKFYEEAWKETKNQIRKKHLNANTIKKGVKDDKTTSTK